MNAQTFQARGQITQVRLEAGRPRLLGGGQGELSVLQGQVWLTRHGDPDDRVLGPGEHLTIRLADRAVLESWARDQSALVQWRPIERSVRGQWLAGGLRGLALLAGGVAFALARAGAGFAALARNAASSARRAQGCISAGDSMASSGAVK